MHLHAALRDLHPLLLALAEVEPAGIKDENAAICSYAIGTSHTVWKETRPSLCVLHHDAVTSRGSGTCNMNVYLRYYTSSYASASSQVVGNPYVALHYGQYVSKTGASYCMFSKHWADNGGGGPFWNKQCSTCL